MKVQFAFLLAAMPALCGLAQTSQRPGDTPVELQHIDVTRVDSAVNPCENFYQYACGKLNAANPIPPDQVFWGVASELQAWNR